MHIYGSFCYLFTTELASQLCLPVLHCSFKLSLNYWVIVTSKHGDHLKFQTRLSHVTHIQVVGTRSTTFFRLLTSLGLCALLRGQLSVTGTGIANNTGG